MPFVLLPLYIYPAPGAWDPILFAAESHPHLTFMVVVNPNSGPGTTTLPDYNYIAALNILGSYDNVQLLGYVCCHYGRRPVAEIEHDVATYGGWEREAARLGYAANISMSGIFLDEAPSQTDHIYWMADVTTSIRDAWAEEEPDRPATVIYNPGVVVDESFYPPADYVVAFEQAEEYRPGFVDEELSELSEENRAKTVVLVHSYTGSDTQLSDIIGELTDAGVAGMLVTHQDGGYYNEWPNMWQSLVGMVAAGGSSAGWAGSAMIGR